MVLGLGIAALLGVLPAPIGDDPDTRTRLRRSPNCRHRPLTLPVEALLSDLPVKAGRFRFSPGARYVLGVVEDPVNALRVWEVASGKPVLALPGGDVPFAAVFVSDLQLLVMHPDRRFTAYADLDVRVSRGSCRNVDHDRR